MTDILIFSRDRAPQLDLLLRSMDENFRVGDRKVQVLYQSTSDPMNRAYWSVFKEWDWAEPVVENQVFELMVAGILMGFRGDTCMFLCDDNVFVGSVEEGDFSRMRGKFLGDPMFHSLSLRMSPDTDYCFPARKRMEVPGFLDDPDGDLVWDWTVVRDQHTCWGYPMAVNTQVYRTGDLVPRILKGGFHNVNSLEAMLNRCRMRERPLMLGFRERKVFDVCNNYVRDGRGGDQDLLDRYLSGERIIGVDKIPDNAAHGIVEFFWERK